MMIADSPEFLESIANHPRVRPWVGGDGVSPVKAGESWQRSRAVQWDDGGVVFMEESPGTFSVHLVFQRKAKNVLEKLASAKAYIMGQPDVFRLVATFPPAYRHVRRCAQAMGLTPIGSAWVLHKETGHGLG
jgi:hypothetical protein